MFGERVGTGLAATALGMLVLVAVMAGGLLVLDRLGGGGLFGAGPTPGDPFVVLDSVDLAEPADVAPEAPQPTDPASADGPAAPAGPAAPTDPPAPAPAPSPAPAPRPTAPTIPEVLPPPGEGDDTLESVVRLSADTVDGAAGTVQDVVGLPAGLISPADAP